MLLGLLSMCSSESGESSAGRILIALGRVRSLAGNNQDAATIDDTRNGDAPASVIVPKSIDKYHEGRAKQYAALSQV